MLDFRDVLFCGGGVDDEDGDWLFEGLEFVIHQHSFNDVPPLFININYVLDASTKVLAVRFGVYLRD